MPEDAIERLRQIHQQRQSVAPRDASFMSKSNDVIESRRHVSKDELRQDAKPELSNSPLTVRSTIRLEEDMDQALRQLCATQRISKEVFLEAALHLCQQDPQLMQATLKEAKRRYKRRKAAGEDRRFETMRQKRDM